MVASLTKRAISYARLSIKQELEFRFNLISEALIQPIFICITEFALWTTVFKTSGATHIAQFPRESYLTYALWAAFLARIQMTWGTEHSIVSDIERGDINSQLLRPGSYFEARFWQFLGRQFLFSLIIIPLAYFFTRWNSLPFQMEHLPLAFVIAFFYLIFNFIVGFSTATLAFRLTKVTGIISAKNIILWMFTGEFFPLDLIPDPYKSWAMSSPFAASVYIPIGLLTGRVGVRQALISFGALCIAIVLMGFFAVFIWRRNLRSYGGTGA